jgi:hypothetical protein
VGGTTDHQFSSVSYVNKPDEALGISRTAVDSATQHRRATGTPYLADLITGTVNLSDQSLVQDYGAASVRWYVRGKPVAPRCRHH